MWCVGVGSLRGLPGLSGSAITAGGGRDVMVDRSSRRGRLQPLGLRLSPLVVGATEAVGAGWKLSPWLMGAMGAEKGNYSGIGAVAAGPEGVIVGHLTRMPSSRKAVRSAGIDIGVHRSDQTAPRRQAHPPAPDATRGS